MIVYYVLSMIKGLSGEQLTQRKGLLPAILPVAIRLTAGRMADFNLCVNREGTAEDCRSSYSFFFLSFFEG